ncbi:isopentenyl-diphosphate Delta-isomerase [Salipiger mucosus]|uniref:Isopentenyl-diphosphate Delta-isomerase n=1 Tax=Salipiger mucosus DSM 16094 TaxID=1123237 RepID=S9QSN8_9RHOB|nr:isopentenyl-diphosphate Delta-isomerase [Salipiger mucosus]EPX82663.1 Isopentenyl-diphosphate delta-isomerase [Salipiger mucosus DSM 16094]
MTTMIPAWVDGTLQPVEKLRAHREALRHKAVSVFVMRRDALLIQRRAAGKYHTPGLWANTCCTHPDWGEDPTDCAHRRLREELGITGLSPRHRGVVEYRADVGGGLVEREVVDLYTAEAPADMPLAPNPVEVMATRWITLADLRQDLAEHPEVYTPWLRIYLAEHADRIFGTDG